MVVVSMKVMVTMLGYAGGCGCKMLVMVVDGKDVAESRHDGEILCP
jgi:hypothetical protein